MWRTGLEGGVFLVLQLVSVVLSADLNIPSGDMSALFSLHNSTGGDSWLWRSEDTAGAVWNFTRDSTGRVLENPCSSSVVVNQTWQGVRCSQTPQVCSTQACYVTDLDVSYYLLHGTLPVEVANFTALKQLYLNNNALTGTIPSEIGELVVLQTLALSTNEFTGTIPSEVWKLTALKLLYLFDNHLTGTISTEVGQLTAIDTIYFYSNELTGTIPNEIKYLTVLQNLALYLNHLNGTIPCEIGQLTTLEILYLYSNELTGTIPDGISQLTLLLHFYPNDNYLAGTFPEAVFHLTTLEQFSIGDNFFTGTIPSELGQLTALEVLSLHGNRLTGTIPYEMGQLAAVELLTLNSNFLSGTIPPQIGQLTSLVVIYLYSNVLTGSIPAEVGTLAALQSFYLRFNQLSSTIPSELGLCTSLEHLSFHTNYLTGSIPSEIGKLTALETLFFYTNHLSGTIPDTIGQLIEVVELWLNDNLLVGAIPVELSNMRKLVSLFLQNNRLTGHITEVFHNESAAQLQQLTNIDLSNNILSGAISPELFLSPHLKVLSLSVNCFDDELQSFICNATRVEVLSLNGLGASEGCPDRFVVPVSDVGLFNTIGGSVPLCVWELLNLTVLHLTGNGLTGKLVQSLPVKSQLADLSLSHNQLSGAIPLDILNIANLDLSYNKLDGEYEDRTQYTSDANISLEINRLSGQLPVSKLELVSNGSLSILHGNMFSCNTIPDNDEYSRDYVCGSQNLNTTLIVFACVFSVIIVLVLLTSWAHMVSVKQHFHPYVAALHSKFTLLWTYLTFIRRLEDTHYLHYPPSVADVVHKIALLSGVFVEVMQYAVQLLVVIVVGSSLYVIIKALDSSDKYATHSHTYSWFWTQAYTHGVVPAYLLLLFWTGTISACFYHIVVLPKRKNTERRANALIGGSLKPPAAPAASDLSNNRKQIVPIGVAFVFNVCITVAVNTLYIYGTQQALGPTKQFFIQLSLSIFRIAYVLVALPLLSRSIRNAVKNVRFRFILITINNLLLPCMVTALTSDSCFQGLLIPADTVSTPYSYRSCVERITAPKGETICSEYRTVEVESAPLVPPFTYNNQCGSVILTSYIPVFLLGYCIQIMLPLIILALIPYIPYASVPPFVMKSLNGIMWPEYWLRGGVYFAHNKDIVGKNPNIMVEIRSIFCNDVLNNWLLMMTFGLCSPILAMAIVCAILLKMSLWVLLIGRFTKKTLCGIEGNNGYVAPGHIVTGTTAAVPLGATELSCINYENRNNKDKDMDQDKDCINDDMIHFSLHALADLYIPLFEVLAGSFWRLVWCSGLFISLLSWDMAMDDVGLLRSVWVPMVPLGYVVMLRCVAYLLDKCNRNSVPQCLPDDFKIELLSANNL